MCKVGGPRCPGSNHASARQIAKRRANRAYKRTFVKSVDALYGAEMAEEAKKLSMTDMYEASQVLPSGVYIDPVTYTGEDGHKYTVEQEIPGQTRRTPMSDTSKTFMRKLVDRYNVHPMRPLPWQQALIDGDRDRLDELNREVEERSVEVSSLADGVHDLTDDQLRDRLDSLYADLSAMQLKTNKSVSATAAGDAILLAMAEADSRYGFEYEPRGDAGYAMQEVYIPHAGGAGDEPFTLPRAVAERIPGGHISDIQHTVSHAVPVEYTGDTISYGRRADEPDTLRGDDDRRRVISLPLGVEGFAGRPEVMSEYVDMQESMFRSGSSTSSEDVYAKFFPRVRENYEKHRADVSTAGVDVNHTISYDEGAEYALGFLKATDGKVRECDSSAERDWLLRERAVAATMVEEDAARVAADELKQFMDGGTTATADTALAAETAREYVRYRANRVRMEYARELDRQGMLAGGTYSDGFRAFLVDQPENTTDAFFEGKAQQLFAEELSTKYDTRGDEKRYDKAVSAMFSTYHSKYAEPPEKGGFNLSEVESGRLDAGVAYLLGAIGDEEKVMPRTVWANRGVKAKTFGDALGCAPGEYRGGTQLKMESGFDAAAVSEYLRSDRMCNPFFDTLDKYDPEGRNRKYDSVPDVTDEEERLLVQALYKDMWRSGCLGDMPVVSAAVMSGSSTMDSAMLARAGHAYVANQLFAKVHELDSVPGDRKQAAAQNLREHMSHVMYPSTDVPPETAHRYERALAAALDFCKKPM